MVKVCDQEYTNKKLWQESIKPYNRYSCFVLNSQVYTDLVIIQVLAK